MSEASAERPPLGWRPDPIGRARRLADRLPAGFWRIAGSAGWLGAEHAVRLAVGLLVGVWVARHLGPEGFGVLNYAISFVFLFSALSRLGLDNLVVRDLIADAGHQGDTLGAAFALRLAGGLLAFALIGATALATQADPTTRLAILIIAGGLIVQSLEVSAYWFYAQTFARPVALARLIALAVISALRIAFILLDKPVLWFAVPVALDAALAAVLMFVWHLSDRGRSVLRWRPRLDRMTAMLRDAWPLALSIVLVELQLRIDQVMLGEMLGAEEVGWYAAAARLSQMLYVTPTLLATAVFPTILRARQTSQALYDRRMQSFYDIMLWLGVAVALPGTLLAGPIIHLLYGAAYAPSATILQIHLWSLVFACTGAVTSRWMVAEGLTQAALGFSVLALLANVLFNGILIPHYGAEGAAWATLLAFVPVLLVCYNYHATRPGAVMLARSLGAPGRLACRRHWRAA